MKRIQKCAIVLLMGAGGCAPLQTYYQPGKSVSALNRDTTGCQVAALRDVPASTQIRRIPPEFVPARKSCDSAGNCTVIPGYVIPGEVITYDPNDGLRKRVEAQCMADQGYAPVSIPLCPDEVARATPAAATTILPPLGTKACVIRNRNGTFQIVNRG
tara:strand:+ start:5464 stop:5937 length:474 start_codon:yes stop_codon:yes gene_type:complete